MVKKIVHWGSFLLVVWLALNVFSSFVARGDLLHLFYSRSSHAENWRFCFGVYVLLLFFQWQFLQEVSIFPWKKKNTNDD